MGKDFRIVELVVNCGTLRLSSDISGQLNMVCFFLRFSPASSTELCSCWYGFKDLFPLYKSNDKLLLTIKTDDSQTIQGKWTCMDGYRRFTGEWVTLMQ